MSNKRDVASWLSLWLTDGLKGLKLSKLSTGNEWVNDSADIQTYLIPEDGVVFIAAYRKGITLEA